MNTLKMSAFIPANILIPKVEDLSKWSVVACDQYTSEPEYWERVKDYVGDAPSTLNLVFPEIYLETEGDNRINSINNAMKEYSDSNLFEEYKASYIYSERVMISGKVRHGLIGAVDLEAYDYHKGSTSLVRATEGTVLERIPPRVKIRCDAILEFPHVMLLVDDPTDSVIKSIKKGEKIYDFDLMENGGHICGYTVDNNIEINNKIAKLADNAGENPLLFAVGDGNHSLATAKECWERIKANLSDAEKENHPARYALCEVVNIHDSSLEFEPIHRVVFDCDADDLIDKLKTSLPICDNADEKVTVITADKTEDLHISLQKGELVVGLLQNFLDEYLKENSGTIDYIHGEDVTEKLAKKSDNNIGFLLPVMNKSDLFPAVNKSGALPRKTFSMGHAYEKRFYLEGRKIR